ncbi:hypothetical protein OG21DRAFT_1517010 [Imleria badia]|nr:hypothetical protein OG21DRAFT_1517010 [Imleria badia]
MALTETVRMFLVVFVQVATSTLTWLMIYHRHQGPETVEPEVKMSEQQYDEQSRRNVEHWVAGHVIPSRVSVSDAPVTYNTLLDGKSITFTPVSSGKNKLPDWSRVTLEDGIHIEMKEGENSIIYMIDRTIKPN